MPEDVVARLLIVQGQDGWDQLGRVEEFLKKTWPECSIYIGGGDAVLPVSLGELRDAGDTPPGDIREFVVRGYVSATRSAGELSSELESWSGRAIMWVFHPAEGQPAYIKGLADGLSEAWGGINVRHGSRRRRGLSPDQTTDDKVIELLVE